jgi:RNA polymerase sigma-70 factor (ECF subfamily)
VTNKHANSSSDAQSILDRPPRYAELAPLADETLMTHLCKGHHDALSVLFDRYHRLVLSIALRILRDAGEAEDLMQSVFLEIFQSAAQFDPNRGTTKVWILQFAYHRSFNRRQYLNLRGFYERPEESVLTRETPIAGHGLQVPESLRATQQALARLSKLQRETVELAFYEGLTMHEIAQKTGESFDAVRHHYYRGLEKLRLILCEAPRARMKTSPGGGVAHVQS